MSETTRPDRRRLLIVAVGAVVALVAIGIGLVVVANDEDDREPATIEIVVPEGTAARLAKGETIIIMPSRLELRVGDVLRIRNDDVVDQSVGPYFVAAGEQFELRYGEPGVYTGYCPLTVDQRYEIVIEA